MGLLLPDRRRRAVAGQDGQVVVQREHAVLQRVHHRLRIGARQIRAPDRAREEHVAGKHDLVAAVAGAQHDAAGRVPRRVDDLEGQARELDLLAVVEVVDVARRHHLGDVEHLAQAQARADERVVQHEAIVRADVHRDPPLARDLADVAGVVDVSVGQQHGLRLEVALLALRLQPPEPRNTIHLLNT